MLASSFTQWYATTAIGQKVPVTTRDLVGWTAFINASTLDVSKGPASPESRVVHGACMVVFDGFGTFLTK